MNSMERATNHSQRKHPVHGVLVPTFAPTIVFLTVCTKDRKAWLASETTHRLLQTVWTKAQSWLVGRYILMPDHLHLFAGLNSETIELDPWVRYWKSQFTKAHKNNDWRWQTDHWDTRMKTIKQYEEKWEYVRHNAYRKGLVEQPEDWPYQGELFPLTW